jgi:signal transduction histidine kinase
MHNRKKVWVASDLTLWLVIGYVIMAAPIAFVGHHWAVNKAETELQTRADRLCSKLAHLLREHVWNLDDEAIARHFADNIAPDDLVHVQVSSQFGDPIGGFRASDESRLTTGKQTITHDDEEIGILEVGLSRVEIEAYRSRTATLTLVVVILVTVAIGLLTSILIRILLGIPLKKLIAQLRTIAAGDYAGRMQPHRYREVDAINAEVNQMVSQIAESTSRLKDEIAERTQAEHELTKMKKDLEHMVSTRTIQLQQTIEALHEESATRRQAQRELLEIGNREQRRIGQDLHDSLGQELAGIAYLASSLERRLADTKGEESHIAGQLSELLRESVSHTRSVAKGLSPVELNQDGLALALQEIANDTEALYRVKCQFTNTGQTGVRDNDVATHLFHITQEAIHNAIRHGNATEIEITLTTDDGRGSLAIHDNVGGYIPRPEDAQGMGLRTMTYRAEMIGGALDIQSTATGTTVTATFENAECRTRNAE